MRLPIRIPGLKLARAKGKLYVYHRASGKRIKADMKSDLAGFLAEVEKLNALAAGRVERQAKTLGNLIQAYRLSQKFERLAARTKADYEKVFLYLEPAWPTPLWDIEPSDVVELHEDAYRARGRRMANYVLAVLSVVFNWGRLRKWIDSNPAFKVPMLEKPTDARDVNRAWTAAEFAAVMLAGPKELQPAIAIGLFLREGNVIRLPWSAYDGQCVRFRARKAGKAEVVPLPGFVRAVLDKAAAEKVSPIIVVGARGRPFNDERGFRSNFFKLIRRLRKGKVVADGLTFHGLRVSMGTWAADAGADYREIAAMLQHETEAMAKLYSRGGTGAGRRPRRWSNWNVRRTDFGKLFGKPGKTGVTERC